MNVTTSFCFGSVVCVSNFKLDSLIEDGKFAIVKSVLTSACVQALFTPDVVNPVSCNVTFETIVTTSSALWSRTSCEGALKGTLTVTSLVFPLYERVTVYSTSVSAVGTVETFVFTLVIVVPCGASADKVKSVAVSLFQLFSSNCLFVVELVFVLSLKSAV